MPLILTVANQKGGVGKTTTAVNLAAGLARRQHPTLLVDLDIQGSATVNLSGPVAPDQPSMTEVLLGELPLDGCLVETATPDLMLAPARESLADVDIELATRKGRERTLGRCLAASDLSRFHYVVVDTAPYLGLTTVSAVLAADRLLVPVSCEYLPIRGLKLFHDAVGELRRRFGAPCVILGYLLTMVDRRERITTEVEELMVKRFGRQVFETRIRVNTHHKASPSHRQTIFQYEPPSGRGRQDFESLTDEVLARL